MHYKKIDKKIICEKYLEDDKESVIPDYKVYCFNGIPKAILVMHNRGYGIKSEFFDVNWNKLENTNKYKDVDYNTEKPKCLNDLIEYSRILSHDFPFVRCDFYIVNGKVIFGELTFTPAGGLFVSQTLIDGKNMADYLLIK